MTRADDLLNIQQVLQEIRIHNRRLFVDLFYPRVRENIHEIEVGLSDVRAADSILISYDFERDGYVIKQASRFCWSVDDEESDSDWREVAFIQAWAREESEMSREVRIKAFEDQVAATKETK